MKKPIYLFSLSVMIGASLLSCKDEARETETIAEEEINTTVEDTDLMEDDSFAMYDANNDDQWDENEFGESYQAEFSGYDADTSGDLNDEEFQGATFQATDMDANNTIDREEWDEGYTNTFGEYANEGDFEKFDTDKSGDLSNKEWNDGFVKTTWFAIYDLDKNKSVSNQEWVKTNFSRWDKNGDGYLSKDEFQAYNQAVMGSNMGNTNNTQNTQNTTGQNNNTQNQ